MADHIYKHGDGVKALALRVDDATSAWEETTKRGAKVLYAAREIYRR
jgi:4-hydroxyphenylpyruvate dioxygenase